MQASRHARYFKRRFVVRALKFCSINLRHVFYVTVTNVSNVSQIPALYAILQTYKENSLDTEGFDLDFKHYK